MGVKALGESFHPLVGFVGRKTSNHIYCVGSVPLVRSSAGETVEIFFADWVRSLGILSLPLGTLPRSIRAEHRLS